MKRLSVIVPGYNTRKEWWTRCIASLDRALTREDEIIVVDDGSAEPVLRDWFASKIVTVIRHDKNNGLPAARNTGLDAAKGAFVTFVDSDDEVRPETYSRCIDALEQHGADVAAYGVRGVYVNDGFVVHDVPDDKYYGELTPSDVGYLVKRRLFYYSCNKVFRKSFLDEHEFRFDPTGVPCEDAIFNVRLVREKAKWVTVAYEGYIYYRYDGSLLSTYTPTYIEGSRACTKTWHDYKVSTPGAYEALEEYGLGWFDEMSEEEVIRGQWTNIWRRKSPFGIKEKWLYAKEHADVLGKCTFSVFMKKAIVMWLRAHCYWKPIRKWHSIRYLRKIGATVEYVGSWKSQIVSVLVICAIVLAICELFARICLGLGDPPISIPDAEMDYLFAPNQDCNRFGNRIVYNNCSMRCDFDVVPKFEGIRAFVVGDSVVNGGVLTDHAMLATTLLQERLDPSRKQIQICHVSAGSWGPGNYAAFFKRYSNLVGIHDILVLELNSHDLWEDDPTRTAGAEVGVDIALTADKPWCALTDGFNRYFVPRIRRKLGLSEINTKVDLARWNEDLSAPSVAYNINALKSICALPFAKRYMLVHKSRKEASDKMISPGESYIRDFAKSYSLQIIELNLTNADYRDVIHLTDSGQKKMANAIYEALAPELQCEGTR